MFRNWWSEIDSREKKKEGNFRLGKWTIIPDENIVRDSQRSIQLEEKVMQVLLHLARANGKLVSREELFRKVWPGVIVTQESLSRCISILRKTFKDDPKDPTVIKTFSKKGYQLLLPVKPLNSFPDSNIIAAGVLLGVFILSIGSFLVFSESSLKKDHYSDNPDWVTSFLGREIFPNPSPIDARMAFSWDGGLAKNWDIYVKEENGEILRLTRHKGREQGSAWSPDGKYIAYIRNEEEASLLFRISSSGGNPEQLISRNISDFSSLSWSTDGQYIAFVDMKHMTEGSGIFCYDIESGRTKALALPKKQEIAFYNPMYSPDGKYLSFLSINSTGTFAVKRLDLISQQSVELKRLDKQITGHSWSRDNKHLLISLQDKASSKVHKLDLQTGELIELGINGSYPRYTFSQSGILAEQRKLTHDIALIPISPELEVLPPLMALSSSRDDIAPSISPDASQLAFASDRNGNYEVYIYHMEDSSLMQLTNIKARYIIGSSWSPDNKYLAINSMHGGEHARLLIYALETGKIWKEIYAESEKLFPIWSQKGDAIFYSVKTATSWDLWKYDLLQDTSEYIVQGGLMAYQNIKGELYFTDYLKKQIWSLNLEDDSKSPSLANEYSFSKYPYRLKDNSIIYLEQLNENVYFRQWMLDKSQKQLLAKANLGNRVVDFDFNVEKGFIFLTVNTQSESDLVMYSHTLK